MAAITEKSMLDDFFSLWQAKADETKDLQAALKQIEIERPDLFNLYEDIKRRQQRRQDAKKF